MAVLPIIIIAALLIAAPPATVETAVIEADRDATLIEDPGGAFANGSGPVLFVGRNNQPVNALRRGLVHFDVAGSLPPDALVMSARLTLDLPFGNPAEREIRLHRVLADWGEGASYATGGSGDASAPGDATWIHSFYDDEFWVTSGGQFVPSPSASRTVGGPGSYTWGSNVHLVRDVRLWMAAPHRNFGWVLIGDETTNQTAKSFSTREEPDPSLRPVLEVTYRLLRDGENLDRSEARSP